MSLIRAIASTDAGILNGQRANSHQSNVGLFVNESRSRQPIRGECDMSIPHLPSIKKTVSPLSWKYGQRYARKLDLADNGDDLAHNLGIITWNGGKSLIVRKQPHATGVLVEFLHGGFFVV